MFVRHKLFLCCILIFSLCHLLSHAATKANDKESDQHAKGKDSFQFYDPNMPSYETVLTPADFETALELEDNPRSSDNDWDSEAMYNLDKFEGDIANDINATTVALFIRGAPEGEKGGNDIQLNAIRDRRQLWRNGRIPYAISSQYSSYSRSVIASAMQEYAKHTCIQWTPRMAVDNDYVYIVPERGCYSMVGRTGGRQTLSLGNGCIQKGIIIHEMMHATGFFHEQSRPDRDSFISILWHNILPGMEGQFEKYSQATIQTLGSDYDYGSIMHYGPNAFTRNGLPTIVPRRQSVIGQRTGFSRLDAWKINALYECPSYGGQYGSTLVPAVPQPQPVTTAAPQMLSTTTVSTTPRLCRNTRPDCDQLARQGWCTRNPHWMREHCPVSCGMCTDNAKGPIQPPGMPSPLPIVAPAIFSSTQSPPSPEPVCEDLRVDCAELAKKRYCITAPSFTRTYCARSCGFCFVPLVTDVTPSSMGGAAALSSSTTASPTVFTQQPFVTFWPPRPERQRGSNVTDAPMVMSRKTRVCQDRKHFCTAWMKAGFCKGIFLGYMKNNCPSACGWC